MLILYQGGISPTTSEVSSPPRGQHLARHGGNIADEHEAPPRSQVSNLAIYWSALCGLVAAYRQTVNALERPAPSTVAQMLLRHTALDSENKAMRMTPTTLHRVTDSTTEGIPEKQQLISRSRLVAVRRSNAQLRRAASGQHYAPSAGRCTELAHFSPRSEASFPAACWAAL